MASLRKRGRTWYYRYHDADGKRHEVKGCTDKRATEEMARAAESEAARVRAGLIDPKALAYRDHGGRPLSEHVAAWRDALLNEGSTPKHADQTADRVRRLVAVMFGARPGDVDGKTMSRARQKQARETILRLLNQARLSDLATERVQAAMARFRDSGRSAQTCNHYRAGIRAFARWAKRTGRLREYPLEGLTGFNANEDRRHDRRTLSLDELTRLIAAAERGSDFQAMSGPTRALCYRLAVATGLRFSEIKNIRPASFDWQAPSVTVAAAYTKNGEEATLPLTGDLADDLAALVAPLPANSPVFSLPEKGVAMLRFDLDAADIPYRDAADLVFDFHSLRCQTATLADAAGVTPRVVQRMMRHSTLELTGRYTKPRAVDIEAAASMLPSLKPVGDRPERAAMTGTHGPVAPQDPSDSTGPDTPDAQNSGVGRQPISNHFAPLLPHSGGGSGRSLADAGGTDDVSRTSRDRCKSVEASGLGDSGRSPADTGVNTPERIRTSNLRFRSPCGVSCGDAWGLQFPRFFKGALRPYETL
jgi:integrase